MLDENAVKPMPCQDRVLYSVSTPPVPKTEAPAPAVKAKPVTSKSKKGLPEKRVTSRAKPKLKPEENQPKVSAFFKPLIVLGNSSSTDDFLPDLVPPKKKLMVKRKDLSFSPDYSPKYTYNFRSGPYALSSPARVNPNLDSPDVSPVFGVKHSNSNGFILLDTTESD